MSKIVVSYKPNGHNMIKFNPELIKKYDVSCPRYTSYPTALQFTEEFKQSDFEVFAKASNESGKNISLYVHLPFCSVLCYFCACNKIITKNKSKGDFYLDVLEKEITMKSKLFDKKRKVTQLHFGGGTPTFFNSEQFSRIMKILGDNFNLILDGTQEYSIEIDPRAVDEESIIHLNKLGLNRFSIGVQDFNPKVQKAINRIQPLDVTTKILNCARNNGFESVNMDLIYGLPHQTLETFSETIEQTIKLCPDRISLFNYAHLPHRFKPQRRLLAKDMPCPDEKLQILTMSIDKLTSNGYEFIGMDHFAKTNDKLSIAQRNGNLYRNFQGYSTHAECDLVALGVSAISRIGNSFAQNAYLVEDYSKIIEEDKLPIIKGIAVDNDDQLRNKIIMELICNLKLDIKNIETKYKINFKEYFASAISKLKVMEKEDNLVTISDNLIKVNEIGRLLIRNICVCFDRYFKVQQINDNAETKHSKAI